MLPKPGAAQRLLAAPGPPIPDSATAQWELLASKVSKPLLAQLGGDAQPAALRLLAPPSGPARHLQQLCDALTERACTLQRLALDRCALTDADCATLARLLAPSGARALQHLSLLGNRVTDAGARALLDAAPPGALRSFALGGNPLGSTAQLNADRAVTRRKRLLKDGKPCLADGALEITL